MSQCASCHSNIYHSFLQTGMGSSFGPATKIKSAAQFGKNQVVYDKFRDFYYHPFWQNDSMYIMEFRIYKKDTIYKRIERVDYIIGSGQHTNSHLTNINGYIYQLPLTWYAQKQQWDLPPGFENGRNIRFTRNIDVECMSCHNAMPVMQKGSNTEFLSIGNGIDCERCHGPGEIHIKEKLAGKIVDTATQIDYTIVNPKKLNWQLQVDLCQRCHLQGNAILKSGKSFTGFRPGMKLSDFVDVFMPKYDGNNHSFIMASHAQRLQMSKCFIESNKQTSNNENKKFNSLNLTCITCHNPHVSVKVTGKEIFNNACIKCHQKDNFCSENKQILLAQNNNCVGCHMPRNGTEDIPHVTVHDHYIRKPEKTIDANAVSTYAGLYCVNNAEPNIQSKTSAYLMYFEKFEGKNSSLDSAWFWINKLNNKEALPHKIHYFFLLNQYQNIVALSSQIKNPDAWTAYRIGQSFQHTKDYINAEKFYKIAADESNNQIQFLTKLGSVKILNNKLDEAIEILKFSLNKQPKQEEALINLGFAYLQKQNINDAIYYYNMALALNPDNTQALYNRGVLLYQQKNTNAAKNDISNLLKLQPNNSEIQSLAKLLNIEIK